MINSTFASDFGWHITSGLFFLHSHVKYLSKIMEMISDDVIYISLLLVSIVLGLVIRDISSVSSRQLSCTLAGVIIALVVSGFHIIHPLIVTFVNALIVLFVYRRYSHIVSTIFCFGYLAFFRSTHYFGLPIPPAHTNAIQMILTLKMVGLAFEMRMQKAGDQLRVSFCDVFQYAFCVAGVLIGPYYKYQTYWDMFQAPYSWAVPAKKFLWKRICVVPFYMLLFLLGDSIFPLSFASSSELLQEPFWYRAFYMIPSFFNFRMRIYAGFVLGECVCIALGLGAYPSFLKPQPGAGPTVETLTQIEDRNVAWVYSYETVRNIDEYGSEFRTFIREGIRSWNRTVQFWLVNFVYKNLNCSKSTKIAITMLVSSFWHGVHPGYYLCLCSAPFFLIAEQQVEKFITPSFHWLWWIIKMLSFSYMGMAFLLLDIRSTLHYWKSIYFIGHIFIALVFFVALKVNQIRVKQD